MKVDTGELTATRAVYEKMNRLPGFREFVSNSFSRYQRGEWGDLQDPDKEANNAAMLDGGRVLARYNSAEHGDIYIITEADRSHTTILFCEEY